MNWMFLRSFFIPRSIVCMGIVTEEEAPSANCWNALPMKHFLFILALGLFAISAIAADTPEDIFWTSVTRSDVVEDYRLYVEQSPKGTYLGEAWRRIGRAEANVAKPAPLIAERYKNNGDGTVTDIITKLQWMRCSMGQSWNGSTCLGKTNEYKWEEARQLSSNFAGYTDWRLPKIEELRSLAYCSSGKPKTWSEGEMCEGDFQLPTIIVEAFPNTPSSYFWSGSPYAGSSNLAWGVSFSVGGAYYVSRYGSDSVRLVRGGQ